MATVELPDSYIGRGRVQGSSWQSPDQILAAQEQKAKEDEANTVTFEEFRSRDGQLFVFRQTPFNASTFQSPMSAVQIQNQRQMLTGLSVCHIENHLGRVNTAAVICVVYNAARKSH